MVQRLSSAKANGLPSRSTPRENAERRRLLSKKTALIALPALTLTASESSSAKATGSDDLTLFPLEPGFAPTTGKTVTLQSIVDKATNKAEAKEMTTAKQSP
jgi:hypothetical protein